MEPPEKSALQNLSPETRTIEELSQQLTVLARELRASGSIPADTVVDEIATSCRSFKELRDKALEILDILAGTSPSVPTAASSMRELDALIQLATEVQRKKLHEEKSRLRALTILDRILSLIHRHRPEFLPLHEIQVQAKTLQETLRSYEGQDLHPDVSLLAQGRHPLAEFLTLVEGHQDLEDDLWLLLTHAVEEHFGKSLAMSAARGKLCPAATRPPFDRPAKEL